MSLPHHNEIACWYDNLEDAKPHYTAVKCHTILQFFTLKGRSSTLILDNIIPLAGITYVYKPTQEERYFLKRYRNWTYEELLHSQDEAIRIFKRRVELNTVWLMFTLQNISDTSEMLKKVYKTQFKEEGKLDYRLFLQILDMSLRYEDYKLSGQNLTGYRTVCNQFSQKLNELWAKAKLTQK